jgi:hypothetical protein
MLRSEHHKAAKVQGSCQKEAGEMSPAEPTEAVLLNPCGKAAKRFENPFSSF